MVEGKHVEAEVSMAEVEDKTNACSIDNRHGEHSPLGLYVSNLPRNLVKALPEMGVEYIPGRGLRQMFPADPHYTLLPAKSVRLSSALRLLNMVFIMDNPWLAQKSK
ncbi:hypothetical protein GOODEAATRI_032453 [Goodea atripinnis]|uniref:Uncharacterized protein n=1 Tax=Goodea atripinnis TaxID=208336 RepID=A0ABV0PIZ4_9TELE